jgi:hypothetical protein
MALWHKYVVIVVISICDFRNSHYVRTMMEVLLLAYSHVWFRPWAWLLSLALEAFMVSTFQSIRQPGRATQILLI